MIACQKIPMVVKKKKNTVIYFCSRKKMFVMSIHMQNRMLWIRKSLFRSPLFSGLGFLKTEFSLFWLGLEIYITNLCNEINITNQASLKSLHWWIYHFFPRLWIPQMQSLWLQDRWCWGIQEMAMKWNSSSSWYCCPSLDSPPLHTHIDTDTTTPAAVLNPYLGLRSLITLVVVLKVFMRIIWSNWKISSL